MGASKSMNTFKEHLIESMSVNIAAGWITPKGKKIDVPAFEHDQFVKDHKKEFNITDKELKALPPDTLPKKLAIHKGAIRFHVFKVGYGHQPTATIGATQSGFRRFKGMIEDIMITNRINEYDLFLSDDDGEFLGIKRKSIFESTEGEIHLWLDDIRPMPEGYNIHAKSAKEAIEHLKTGKVTKISLDHDLGLVEIEIAGIKRAKEDENAPTGYDVAKWIEEAAYLGKIGRLEWDVHSANPIGAKRISEAMRMADQFWSHHDNKKR